MKSIQIFRFQDAPKKFRDLDPINGDDCDFLAVVHKSMVENFDLLIEKDFFGCCDIFEVEFNSETLVLFGHHS